jgi:hypothetical protein
MMDDIAAAALDRIEAINAKAAIDKARRRSAAVVTTMLNEPSEKTVRLAGTFMGFPVYLDPEMPYDVVGHLYDRLK